MRIQRHVQGAHRRLDKFITIQAAGTKSSSLPADSEEHLPPFTTSDLDLLAACPGARFGRQEHIRILEHKNEDVDDRDGRKGETRRT